MKALIRAYKETGKGVNRRLAQKQYVIFICV